MFAKRRVMARRLDAGVYGLAISGCSEAAGCPEGLCLGKR